MKLLVWFIIGFLEGVTIAVLIGMLSVQISGALSGAVYDLSNTVVAVTTPTLPLLQYVAVAGVGLLTVYTIVRGSSALPQTSSIALPAGITVGLLTLVTWSFILQASRIATPGVGQGLPTGWDGWVLLGGSNSTVHLLLLVAGGAFVINLRQRNRASETAKSVDESDSPVTVETRGT